MDALFIFTNAPGQSAFSCVERSITSLSRALSGVILSHDQYGSHLDNNGKTIDTYLEMKNVQYVDETLAKIWSDMKTDGYSVTAEFVPYAENVSGPT